MPQALAARPTTGETGHIFGKCGPLLFVGWTRSEGAPQGPFGQDGGLCDRQRSQRSRATRLPWEFVARKWSMMSIVAISQAVRYHDTQPIAKVRLDRLKRKP